MLARWLLRFAIGLPATTGAVLLASAGNVLPFEARIAAGAVTFSAIATARDTKGALVRAALCVAACGVVAALLSARG